ncbi:hypothetical protein JRC04_04880 [Mycolicibacterium sp. S2-37]|uniref:hypothetical protein n=1 Tax=Mycolicibacterium sp. S2-37 TaxID=2810297 RepID=UPI001A946DE8|nr:hypothetical protein [Mycolicibacterium sp. S2-37]MBO0676794.1 hypothetical protein [Mycolicibacterium sp. S2-37]
MTLSFTDSFNRTSPGGECLWAEYPRRLDTISSFLNACGEDAGLVIECRLWTMVDE